MKYDHIQEGRFVSRPNRFIAYVEMDGKRERVHVKNTGRCRELLTEGAVVYLDKAGDPKRSTGYDLVAVKKGRRLINMDSQAPNQAVGEWLEQSGCFSEISVIKPEFTYHNSRFDFYVETAQEKILIEVKGVTLEQNNVVLFPDAPSERAVKHVQELAEAVKEGYRAVVLFVIQMQGASYFIPNRNTHPAFADALEKAKSQGVEVLAYDCLVTPDSMKLHKPVLVRLSLLEQMTEPLLSWYAGERRILPWREEPTPYHVWVSEIMLQQTRVEAVKPYYDRFMEAIPDISHLAEAEEERLLKLWEGLGYYNRVRNLKKAARIIMEQYGGKMPEQAQQLKALPGIGSYTAGAISSIAYNHKVPAVDGNVLRVLSRLRADERDIAQVSLRSRIEEELLAVMPEERPGDFNQALMELGATVCIPSGMPHCGQCPWEGICLAHSQGKELSYPHKSPSKAKAMEKKTVLILQDENRAALCKRPAKGLLAGMYEFPCIPGHLSRKQVIEYLKREGISVLRIESIGSAKHVFTHKEWHMIGYSVRVDELSEQESKNWKDKLILAEPETIREQYPIPSAYKVYLQYFFGKN